MRINGWGKYPAIDAQLFNPASVSSVRDLIDHGFKGIPRGLGRSYGDSALAPAVIGSGRLRHFLAFDATTGVLQAEAGVSLGDVVAFALPRGWMLPVTPGTRFVSLAGAIASDVHGKNHHQQGCFSAFVRRFWMILGNGELVEVSRSQLPDLFQATCGGMGLTGVIVRVEIQLKKVNSAYIRQQTLRCTSLDALFTCIEQQASSTYSVSWVDCLAPGAGHSLLFLGEHATDEDYSLPSATTLSIPMDMPGPLLNRWTVKLFNMLYFMKARSGFSRLSCMQYFYPLDSLLDWNRLYGRNGFVQYQFVLPESADNAAFRQIFQLIARSGQGSMLAVLKKFGSANDNFLSFPRPGYTLALDFKLSRDVIRLLGELDLMVAEYGGRVYLAKDALLSREVFRTMYPRWEEFQSIRVKYGALGVFQSTQSQRLGLEE